MNGGNDISVAVVTGGYSFDVLSFHRLFDSLQGVKAVIQHMDDFTSSPDDVRDSYAVVVFFSMLRKGPDDEGHPWYAGRPLSALQRLGTTSQGIVLLHHAILAYPEWDAWTKMVGIAHRGFDYHLDQKLTVRVADPKHPITRGLPEWEMVDEIYTMSDTGQDSHVLLVTDHPRSMKTLAWTREHGKSRVFCFQSGCNQKAWSNPSFREVLRRGILWTAGRRLERAEPGTLDLGI